MSFFLGCITILLVSFCIHYIFGFDNLGLKATEQKQESILCSFSLDITSFWLTVCSHFVVPSYIDLSMGFYNKSCLCCVACCLVRSGVAQLNLGPSQKSGMATCLRTLPSNIWAGSQSGSRWAPEESCRAFLILFCKWVDTHPCSILEEVEQARRFMRLAAITRIVEEKNPAELVRKERHLYSCS